MVVRMYTVDEFEQFLSASSEGTFELIDGRIVEKVPTEAHSLVAGNFYTALRVFVKPRNLGRVAFEVRYQMPGDEHNARMPDVSFTRTERLLPVVTKGAVPHMPDLCIEIQSPDDNPKDMRDKAAYYLANGAQLVWLAYYKKRMVEALYPNGEFDIFNEGDMLTGGDLLPGFAVKVSELLDI